MDQISIIINGVRYDAVKAKEHKSCKGCELKPDHLPCLLSLCNYNEGDFIFKKINLKFSKNSNI